MLALALCASVSACSHLPSWMGGAKEEKPKLPGERITVLPTGRSDAPDDSLKMVAVAIPPAQQNSDWPQHTGIFRSTDSNLSAKGFSTRTSASAGDGESFSHTLVPRPVVAGGTVYSMDAEGNISARDAANLSSLRWESKGVSEKHSSDVLGGGLSYDQGKLYAVSGRGLVIASDAASGKELWRRNLNIPLRSAPAVADGKLFVITIDSQLFALNSVDGSVLWTHRGINEVTGLLNAVSPVVAGRTVIVPYASGEIYALSQDDGKPLWDQSMVLNAGANQSNTAFSGIGGDPVVDGDVVFAVSNSGMLSVYSIIYGQRIWDKPVASLNTPWVAGDYLYLISSDNTLICFVKYDGRIRWSLQLASFEDEDRKLEPITWRGPVMADGKLALVGSHGKLVLVSAADGTIAATESIPDGIATAPVIAGGRMYLVGKNATLYSLQ